MKIYVLVYVEYDHYRFQENLYANTDRKKLLDIIRSDKDYLKLPLYEYKEEPIELKDDEVQHLWIEEFEID